MADNAEYNRLVNQRRTTQSQYRACESRIEQCDYLLRRLKPAKNAIAGLKESFNRNQKRDKELYKEKSEWVGSTYDRFGVKMESLIDNNEIYYEDTIDYILDSINDEITRIENEKMNEQGLLGRLASKINSLANKIENFFN